MVVSFAKHEETMVCLCQPRSSFFQQRTAEKQSADCGRTALVVVVVVKTHKLAHFSGRASVFHVWCSILGIRSYSYLSPSMMV